MNGPGRGMDLPTGSVLDRVKMFLPVIAAANDELQQKISREGQDSVQIDKHLDNQISNSDSKMVTEDDDINAEDDDAEDDAEEGEEQSSADPSKVEQRVVELNFALGDFDESKIALLEELGKEDSGDEDDDKEDDEN